MSEIFEVYQTNFLKSIRLLQQKLREDKDCNTAEMNQAISEATQQLSKMQIEYRMCRHRDLKTKINLYKEQLRSCKRKLSEDRAKSQDKERLSDQTLDKQQDLGTNLLKEAKRQMYENVELSDEVTVGVKKNNEKLLKNITRVGDIDSNLVVAKQLLGSIKQKMSKNKYILSTTILALVLVLLLVIYTHVK